MSAAQRDRAPRVYGGITAVTAELARIGVPKSRTNAQEQYAYRGIDDLCIRLAPLLSKHRLCILPRVLERGSHERAGENNSLLVNVSVRVAFDIVSARDGSSHTIEAYGEALDAGDKATAKAMSAAFKQALLQAFCIPVEGAEDAEASTHRLAARSEVLDPDQGWDQWSADIQDMIGTCESEEALERVQSTYRALLRAASKRRPDIFVAIGKAIAERRQALRRPATAILEAAGHYAPHYNGKAIDHA